jgi:hypothetical protein
MFMAVEWLDFETESGGLSSMTRGSANSWKFFAGQRSAGFSCHATHTGFWSACGLEKSARANSPGFVMISLVTEMREIAERVLFADTLE